jgi:hypothetical protein
VQDIGARRRSACVAIRAAGDRDQPLSRVSNDRHIVASIDDVTPAFDEEIGKVSTAVAAIVERKVQLVYELLNLDVVHGGQRRLLRNGPVLRLK